MNMVVERPPVSRTLAALDHETGEHHARAEADLFLVLDDSSRAGYQHFLSAVFHFEHPVENQLARVEALPLRFVATRLKTGRLGADLVALGQPRKAGACDPMFARPMLPPRFRDGYDALAWMYVLQRNTLQHRALYRALAPRLRGTLQLASRYLTAHASDVYLRWHELGVYLDQVVTPDKLHGLVATAREAFGLQHAWYVEAFRQTRAAA
jgi:heme oxygenase